MADSPPIIDPWAALRESERRAEGLQARLDAILGMIGNISEAIYIHDAEGRFLEVNEGAARMYGYPRDFFIGKSPEALGAPGKNDPAMVAQAFLKAFQGVPQIFEYWGRRRNGEIFPKEVRLYPGSYLGEKAVIAVAQDISARKSAERTQEATYCIARAALESRTPQELFARVHTIIRGLMPAENLYFALWDPATDTVSFPYWADVRDPAPEPRKMRRGLTEYLLRSGQPLLATEARWRELKATGEIESFGSPSLDWLGVPLRGETGVFGALVIQSYEGGHRYTEAERDLLVFVSSQVALSIERAKALAEQHASEDKFSRAFHGSPDAIVITRLKDGMYLDVSQGFERLTGWTREEAISHSALEMDIWANSQDRDRAMDLIRTHGEYTGMEFIFRRKDGSLVSGLMSGKTMLVDGIPCVLSITRDITDRKRTEEALRQSQKLESLGILAGGIAHDFNNLLTVVLGNLNLAQMHLPEDAAALPYLANMEATVLRATELTKQMLAYSGRGHFLVKPQDLNVVVREVTHLLEVSISKKIRLKFDLEPGVPAIQADAAQIQQVVMNLVTNASDAIGDQDGAIHLSTSAALLDEEDLQSAYQAESLPSGLYTILEVSDTGVGMSPEVMARMFDPFFTTKAKGRGLGLSAMLGILRGHRAGLNITSVEGQGSTFRLCFPASSERPAASVPSTETPSPLRGRILLVDDEELILQTIGAALKTLGLDVLTARDGLEALECFQKAEPRPDLVLMDLTMPRMDGREAFLAMHKADPSIPVVLSSGYMERDSLQSLTGDGPAEFIQKPYQIKELRRMLERVLGP